MRSLHGVHEHNIYVEDHVLSVCPNDWNEIPPGRNLIKLDIIFMLRCRLKLIFLIWIWGSQALTMKCTVVCAVIPCSLGRAKHQYSESKSKPSKKSAKSAQLDAYFCFFPLRLWRWRRYLLRNFGPFFDLRGVCNTEVLRNYLISVTSAWRASNLWGGPNTSATSEIRQTQ
jgi:hypothetical protein